MAGYSILSELSVEFPHWIMLNMLLEYFNHLKIAPIDDNITNVTSCSLHLVFLVMSSSGALVA